MERLNEAIPGQVEIYEGGGGIDVKDLDKKNN